MAVACKGKRSNKLDIDLSYSNVPSPSVPNSKQALMLLLHLSKKLCFLMALTLYTTLGILKVSKIGNFGFHSLVSILYF